MTETKEKRVTQKALRLLELHENEIIKELGASAFEILTPKRAAQELGMQSSKGITDLVRQKWLASIPDENAGPAHLYYRWRVEFVKRYKLKHNNNPVSRSS